MQIVKIILSLLLVGTLFSVQTQKLSGVYETKKWKGNFGNFMTFDFSTDNIFESRFGILEAQNDTVYVFVDDSTFFSIKNKIKFPNDPDLRVTFPFNGGKAYQFYRQKGKWKQTCHFSFSNWHPTDETPYPGFEYQKVHKSILTQRDFKNSLWFRDKTYREVLDEFAGRDKRIYLIDYSEMVGDSTYMVTVNFTFPAIE